jgi:ribosome maturation factor RimP
MSAHSRPAQPRARGSAARGGAARPPAAPARAADAERVAELLAPVAQELGLDLEGVKITAAGRRRLVRITVDSDDGVSLDDISRVSKRLSALLEEAGTLGEAPYTLEISSPGVDRPLTEPRHWRRAAGRLVKVTVTGLDGDDEADEAGTRTVQGRVAAAGDLDVSLDTDGQVQRFGYAELGPGRIQVEFGHPRDDLDESADEGTEKEEPDGH